MTDFTLITINANGRSGSTLLELLLAAHSQIATVGELKMLYPKRQLASERQNRVETCDCSAAHIAECPFWQQVGEIIQREQGLPLHEINLLSGDDTVFASHNKSLLSAVSRVSGSRYIVDASKYTDRLASLLRTQAVAARHIHLIRSPFGNIDSHMRRGRHWVTESISYTGTVTCTHRLLRNQDHFTVYYEELSSQPERVLAALMAWLGLSFEPQQLDWAQHTHHRIGGNEKVRVSDSNAIRRDVRWRESLTLGQKVGIALLTLPARVPDLPLYEVERLLYDKIAAVRRWLG